MYYFRIFKQRCTSILDIMNAENSDETIGLLTTNSSVWGIYTSPLTFAYEKWMYDVVAHTCSKKYLKLELYNNLATDAYSFLTVKKEQDEKIYLFCTCIN